jgi:3-hydroxyisobutyrate dehydrogenase-like beta-hydroxyacid dehydrogenase
MSPSAGNTSVGFIGLGDQGLPMAIAIAEAGYELHVWARRPSSIYGLGQVAHVPHAELSELAAACQIVGVCVSTDEDVRQLVVDGLLGRLAAGSVVVNHGTGTPRNAIALSEACAPAGVEILDAPVSGGRPGAGERRLLTMVGGPRETAERCRPVFETFSRHVVHLGGAGAGQTAKLLNNALLMLNQQSVLEIVELAAGLGLEPVRLVEVLKLGSANSNALGHFGSLITPENVGHLAAVEALDMELFATAMRDAGVDAEAITARGLAGANGLASVMRRLQA